MISRRLAIIYCCIIFASCGSKKEFVITDDYVSRELGAASTDKNEQKSVKLSDKERTYFAVKLGVKPAEITNDRLYSYIRKAEDKKYPGSAALVSRVYADVYGKKISGDATEVLADKRLELFKSSDNLREGDLVFFRTSSNAVVTHVGVYLKNNRFLSAQGNKAAIYNLKKGSWKNNFATAARLRQ